MSVSPKSLKTRLDEVHAKRARGEGGFTLIELLVVVVIIGILVAIAIPLYLNYRKGAQNKATESDVRGAVSAFEQCFTDNGNKYPEAAAVTGGTDSDTPLSLDCGDSTQTAPLSKDTKTLTYSLATDKQSYTLVGSSSGGKTYTYTSSDGTLDEG
ncbi:type IV pilin protein [Jatrophihabitans sp. YIM 134969]